MNILITSIGQKTNLAKYFRRALANEGGGQVLGADSNSSVLGKHFVDKFIRSPDSDSQGYANWLLNVIEAHEIRLVVPTRDGELSTLSSLVEVAWSRSRCRILVPASETLHYCLDKSRFSQWCHENNFKQPNPLSFHTLKEADVPFIIKPRTGSGAKDIKVVHDWDEWCEIQPVSDKKYIVQEYVQHSPEYSIDLFVDWHGEIKSVVPRIRLSVSRGETIHGRVDLDAEIIEQSSRLARTLGLVGHNTIQCFKRDSAVLFTEVNARYGGGFTLGVESGADTPRFIVREVLGKDIHFNRDQLVDQLEMVRIQKDIFTSGTTRRKVYCFDLDGTLCTESCTYEEAKPIQLMIDKVNRLYGQGHEIVIATARGASSGVSWRTLIEEQLNAWGVQYHRLVTDKPFADYYIDNKSIDVLEFI
ncbi:MAG: ATP-grasp domain-containing protein [Pseudomonadales bacterium]|nr:ATP-grasp domain-containing protein [Pseudomonadales bacterium]